MRNKQGLMFLGASIVLGLVGFFVLSSWLESQKPTALQTQSVVVTSVDVSLGTELTKRHLAY